jgi:NitT/TauT family transport system ATP-binding protein
MQAPPAAKLSLQGVSLDHVNERTQQVLPVLRDIDLTVDEGELVCLVGPSGCGKTTLLNAVDGLIHTIAGRILVTAPWCFSTTACSPGARSHRT